MVLFQQAKELLSKARKLLRLKKTNKRIDGFKVVLCTVVWIVSGINSYCSSASFTLQPKLTTENAAYYEGVIEQDPENADAHYRRGAIYYLQKQHQLSH